MIITGKINKKELKATKANVPYCCFTIDDKNWNCFDALVHNQFNVGDVVTITTKTDKTGKFENLVSMTKADDPAVSSSIDVSAGVPSLTDKERRVIACLKELVRILENGN